MTVKTKTKEYPINWMAIGSLDPLLRISFQSKDLAELVCTLSDKEEAETLINVFEDGQTIEYHGYTKIMNVSATSDGTVIALQKETT